MQADRAHRELGFRIHAIVFFPTNFAMAVVNYFTGPLWWIGWVILAWGVGLFSHWLFTLRLATKS